LFAYVCFALALVAIVGSVVLFSSGFAGPAPIALAGAGGLIAAGAALWRPPADGSGPGRGRYPT
jgi:hypothetical protein